MILGWKQAHLAMAGTIFSMKGSLHPHMGEGGMAGGMPLPSVQKPIPSSKAENQGPSKKFLAEKGEKFNFFKKYLSFVIFARKDRTLILLQKLVSYSCFCKNPSFLL